MFKSITKEFLNFILEFVFLLGVVISITFNKYFYLKIHKFQLKVCAMDTYFIIGKKTETYDNGWKI